MFDDWYLNRASYLIILLQNYDDFVKQRYMLTMYDYCIVATVIYIRKLNNSLLV